MGFEEKNIFLFTSDRKQTGRPSRTNLSFALDQISNEIRPGGEFIFFFSGHGIYMEGESYLLTVEADPRNKVTLEDSCLKCSRVRELIQKMKADKVLMMIDACRSDPRSNKGGSRNLMKEEFTKGLLRISSKAFETVPRAKVLATLYACSPGESSYESGEVGNATSLISY